MFLLYFNKKLYEPRPDRSFYYHDIDQKEGLSFINQSKLIKSVKKWPTPVEQNDLQFIVDQYDNGVAAADEDFKRIYEILKVKNKLRDKLRQYLAEKKIETIVNYPFPCYKQKAYLQENVQFPNAEWLCECALSLPVYPEISEEQLLYICNSIKEFFSTNE